MKSYRILVVEDSQMVQMLVQDALAAYEVEIDCVNNGLEALEFIQAHRLDLIILDITMPVMGGVETLAKLRANPTTATLPVIMLTAESGRKTVVQIAQMGVQDYLCKPFEPEILVEHILKLLPLKVRLAGLTTEAPGAVIQAKSNIVSLVEDKLATVERIKSILSETTLTLRPHIEPSKALTEIKANPPGCILLSLGLSVDFTRIFYQQIRSDGQLQNIPVIGLSVKVKTEEQKAAREIGIRSIVTKPIDPIELKSILMREMGLTVRQIFVQDLQNCAVLRVPAGLNEYNEVELSNKMQEELTELIEAGTAWQGLIIDLHEFSQASLAMGRLVVELLKLCQQASLPLRTVGSSELETQSRVLVELRGVAFYPSIQEAIGSLSSK